ncbi:MAG: type VI secretion system tip protein VgrG [Candidatus Competibacteraceae bacterium]|nr:type VI secretion system tip protein VgrG [Candidatus Competibacteraceae bacterium]
MAKPTQDYRDMQIASVLGKDVLLFRSMVARERLSQPFEYELEALSLDANIDFKKIIGTSVSVRLLLPNNHERYLNGWVSQFSQIPSGSVRYATYRFTLRPWLWFLTRYSDCRFFQDKNAPDIIKDIFTDRGYEDFDMTKLSLGDYPKREYCVQYRETDFNFVSRLMEDEGIYYYFEHTSDGKNILTLADNPNNHTIVPGFETLTYGVSSSASSAALNTIFEWSISQSVQSGEYALNSFDFENPASPLYSPVQMPKQHPQGQAAMYDYPGPDYYADTEAGRRYARIRLEELHTAYELMQAKTNALGLTAGKLFTLQEHPRADLNRQYLITSSRVTLYSDYYEASNSGSSEPKFTCELGAIDAKQQFRPARLTPKPFVQGPQTAIVVPEKGQESEEISTDKHGRIKVQFHWNRPENNMDGKHQQDRSCWIRVSHPWAGKNWGMIHLPRVGQEVIVDFEEGDPDRPICTGRVYNGSSKPPYELPTWKAYSTNKSNTTKGGNGFNEIRYDDRKDKEQIFIHAQKRMDVRVRGSVYETCGGTRQIRIGMRSDDKPGGNLAVSVGGDTDIHIKGALFEGIDKKVNQTVAEDVVCDHQAKEAIVVGDTYELNARQITLEALQQITLKVGSSFMTLDLTGITISAPMVKINSGGSAQGTGPVDIQDPLDATPADTGVPGYLDSLPRRGGSPGRNSRTLTGQHGPTVTRNADGSYQVGSIRVNQGTDPNFQRDTLNDIAIIGTTTQGQQTLNNINSSGRNVTINERPPAAPGTSPNAGATAANPTNAANGTGTDSTVTYNPNDWPAAAGVPGNNSNAPSDVILHHELTHADHHTNGTRDGTARADCFTTNEEFNTIGNPNGPDNAYRDERGVPRRTNHKDF